MPTLTLTLPILPGKTEAWRRFCQELAGLWRREYEASRRRLGVTEEQFALVEVASGAAASLHVKADDLGRLLTGLASSEDVFDRWFRHKLVELHGFVLIELDPDRRPPIPHQVISVFQWQQPERRDQ